MEIRILAAERAGRAASAAFCAAFVAAISSGARAQSSRPSVEVSVFTGNSFTQRSDLRINQPRLGTDAVFHEIDWQARPFSASFYYGYRFAAFLPRAPRLGFEVDLLHYKMYAKVHEQKRVSGIWQNQPIDTDAEVSDRVQEFRITNGVNVVTLGAVYRVPLLISPAFPQGRVQPYVGFGPSYYVLYAINTVGGETNHNRGYKAGGWGVTAQTGVRYALTRHFSLFGEGRYNSGTAHVGIADGGIGQTPIRSLHTIGGATVRF